MQSSFHVPHLSGAMIKSIVVSSYFMDWINLIEPHAKKVGNKVGLLDFFCGSGKNVDGSEAAPLLVLKNALENEHIATMLVSVFCDKEPKNIIKLRQAVTNLMGVERLMYQPQFDRGVSIDDLVSNMQQVRLLPSLILLDAIGVKDLSLDSVSAHIKEGNFDCIFNISYSVLEKMIGNPFKARHLEMIFGKMTADKLRHVSDRLNTEQKENLIITTFLSGLKSLKGFHYVIIKSQLGLETNYLLFATRYATRYRLMKEVLIQMGCIETPGGQSGHEVTGRTNFSVQYGLFNTD